MSDPDRGLEEQTLAWSKYRAWGNQNEFAIHIYAREGEKPIETPLGQQDCARELAFLQSGGRPELLDAPWNILQAEFNRLNIEVADKSDISRAFQFNEKGGTIASNTGRKIEPVVCPAAQNVTPKVGRSREFREFLEWFKVGHSQEFQDLEVARSQVERLRKVVLSNYKLWRQSRTPETQSPPPIIPITPESLTVEAAALVVVPEEAPPPFPDLPDEYSTGDGTGTATARETDPGPTFGNALKNKFAGKSAPTPAQCRKAHAKLLAYKLQPKEFLEYLTPDRMASIQHGGVLDQLVEGYHATLTAKAKAPPGCPYCGCDRFDKITGNCAACQRSREMATRAAERRARGE